MEQLAYGVAINNTIQFDIYHADTKMCSLVITTVGWVFFFTEN